MGRVILSPAQTMSHGEEGFDVFAVLEFSELPATDFLIELSIGLFDVFCSGVKVSQKYSNRVDFLHRFVSAKMYCDFLVPQIGDVIP